MARFPSIDTTGQFEALEVRDKIRGLAEPLVTDAVDKINTKYGQLPAKVDSAENTLSTHGARIAINEYAINEVNTQIEGTFEAADRAAYRADIAASSATHAWGANEELIPRVEHIETMAGLAPGEVTDAQTANLISQPSTETRGALNVSYAARASVLRHVKDFGAVGDGATDDTDALNSAFAAEVPLNFGGSEMTYRVTEALVHTAASAPIIWSGSGAKIKLDSDTPLQRAISIDLAGNHAQINGIELDCRRNAFTGFFVSNNHDTYVDLTLEDLFVANVHRADDTMTGGDAIHISGAFDRVTLNRPTIKNVTMAAGAGVRGFQGVSGVTVKSHGENRYPKQVTVSDPFIDGVYSEDNTYLVDQDGIKVFAAEDVEGNLVPYESHFNITGGTLRNCMGRAVKSQMEWGVVDGIKIYRDIPKGPGATDIDFQVGGGIATNIDAHYHGSTPVAAVGFSRPSTDGKLVPHGSVNNLRILVTGESELPQAVLFNQRTTYATTSYLNVRAVEVIGNPVRQVVRMNGVAGGNHHLALSDVFAAPHVALVSGGSGTGRWYGTVMASNCLNTGAQEVQLFEAASSHAAPQVTATGCINWSSQKYLSRGSAGPMTRVDSIAPMDSVDSGVLRPVSFRLQNGAVGEFPQSFALGNTGMLIVSVGHTRLDQGIFVCDASQVLDLVTFPGRFGVGFATEPEEGTYRLWVDADTQTIRISNRSGSARTITALMFG